MFRCRRHAPVAVINPHKLGDIVRGAFDVVVEIGQHPEHFVKFAIEFFQQIINVARADQNDLDVERNHFRFEGDGINAQFRVRRFDFYATGFQAPASGLPRQMDKSVLFRRPESDNRRWRGVASRGKSAGNW